MSQQDFLQACMADVQAKDSSGFEATYCDHCRQMQCGRAKWSQDKFGQRVATQVDRLLHPTQADPTSSRYEHLTDFPSMMRQAMQLEEADRRRDWTVPDLGMGEEEPLIMMPPSQSLPTSRPAIAPKGNTAVPKGGILLPGTGGTSSNTRTPVLDPWAPVEPIQIVPSGATIKLKP